MPNISRRTMISGAAASLVATPSLADISCTGFNAAQLKRCSVGLLNVPVVKQQCKDWCWAASAELAFKVQGYNVPQQRFVKKLFSNNDVCKTANSQMLANAVSGNWTDNNGTSFYADFRVILDHDNGIYNNNPLDVIRNELESNRIVIAGTLGHAVCITAMDYAENRSGQQQFINMTVRDPWPGSGNKYYMSRDQFANGRLLATILFS